MGVLSSVVSALSTFYPDSLDPHDPEQVQLSILRLMAKCPTIAAYSYKRSIGQPFLYPNNELDLIENFLTMMFAVPSEPYEVTPTVAARDEGAPHPPRRPRAELLHVDRAAGRLERRQPLRAVAAGINALWGPLHGGANQAVIEMLESIRRRRRRHRQVRDKAKDPDDPFRLSGFGHRVYKNYDPRARIIKGPRRPGARRARRPRRAASTSRSPLEEVALNDDFFVERKLYPNVDFYSGLIYRAMGFPTNMFTVLFAMGRLPGWIAHWKEMMENPKTKIGRPRQIYTGPTERPYVPVEDR